MKPEDIQVGKTYEGRTGKPRTVIAIDVAFDFTEVRYTQVDESFCLDNTFSRWAVSEYKPDAPTSTVAVLREALEQCRNNLALFIGSDDALGQTWLRQADAALAATDVEAKQ